VVWVVVTLLVLPPFLAPLGACVEVFAAVALRFWMPARVCQPLFITIVMELWKEVVLPLREFKDFRGEDADDRFVQAVVLIVRGLA
jgi:hypothetical protein